MLKKSFVLLCMLSFVGLTACEKKVTKLNNDDEQISYAIGQQIGKNLKQQNVEFDPKILAASLTHVIKNEKSLMTEEDIQKAMVKLREKAEAKMKAEAEKNKSDGVAFLEKNKTAEGVKTTASGLQYIIVSEGTGKMPKETDTVRVHYTGTLTNGEKFDSSVDRGEPAEFPLNGVIKGWTEGLQLLKTGSKAKFFIPADLAYGEMPRPGIPGNSVLVFDVELIDIVTKKK